MKLSKNKLEHLNKINNKNLNKIRKIYFNTIDESLQISSTLPIGEQTNNLSTSFSFTYFGRNEYTLHVDPSPMRLWKIDEKIPLFSRGGMFIIVRFFFFELR